LLGVHWVTKQKMLMNTNVDKGEQVALDRYGRAILVAVGTFLGVSVALSAIASVGVVEALDSDAEITKQILDLEHQESDSRIAHQLDGLITPRSGLSGHSSTFKSVGNPVLTAELKRMSRSKLAPEQLTLATLALIEDASAFGEVPLNTAPKAAESPRKRGQAQWHCLTEAIYFEARSESIQAQRAVAEVILNRVDSRRYPNTVCEVINQGAHKRHLTHGATHYHTTAVRPFWSRRLERTSKYGAHIFYKRGTRVSSR